MKRVKRAPLFGVAMAEPFDGGDVVEILFRNSASGGCDEKGKGERANHG